MVLGGWIVPNARIRELCGVMKGVDKRIEKGVLWIAKSVYVGVCAGSHSVSGLRKRWIYTVKDYLRRGLDVRQAKRMVQSPGGETQTLMRYPSCGL